jgi:hypothetical protein
MRRGVLGCLRYIHTPTEMTSLYRVAVSSACALSSATAAAQGAPPWDPGAARAIVTSAADATDSIYVFPDKGRTSGLSPMRTSIAGECARSHSFWLTTRGSINSSAISG